MRLKLAAADDRVAVVAVDAARAVRLDHSHAAHEDGPMRAGPVGQPLAVLEASRLAQEQALVLVVVALAPCTCGDDTAYGSG